MLTQRLNEWEVLTSVKVENGKWTTGGATSKQANSSFFYLSLCRSGWEVCVTQISPVIVMLPRHLVKAAEGNQKLWSHNPILLREKLKLYSKRKTFNWVCFQRRRRQASLVAFQSSGSDSRYLWHYRDCKLNYSLRFTRNLIRNVQLINET